MATKDQTKKARKVLAEICGGQTMTIFRDFDAQEKAVRILADALSRADGEGYLRATMSTPAPLSVPDTLDLLLKIEEHAEAAKEAESRKGGPAFLRVWLEAIIALAKKGRGVD